MARTIQEIEKDINEARQNLDRAREDVRRLEGEKAAVAEIQAAKVGQEILALKTTEERVKYLEKLGTAPASTATSASPAVASAPAPAPEPEDPEAHAARMAAYEKEKAEKEAALQEELAAARRRQIAAGEKVPDMPVESWTADPKIDVTEESTR